MSSSKLIFQGVGYDPAIGPQSTDPNLQSAPSTPSGTTPQHAFSNSTLSPSQAKKKAVINNFIYERNLHRAKHEISTSVLSFLFMEILSINLNNSKSLVEIERKLNNLGYTIGLKYLELCSLRTNFNNNITSSGKSNVSKREIRLLETLQYIVTNVWSNLFDKPANNLEKSSQHENQYMIIDENPIMTKFICVPKEYENLNCEAFVAGIIEGILDVSYFRCEVSAHTVPTDNCPNRTVYLIKFDDSIIKREHRLGKK